MTIVVVVERESGEEIGSNQCIRQNLPWWCMAIWRNRILKFKIGAGEKKGLCLCICGCLWKKEKRLEVEPHGYNKVVPIVEVTIVLGFGFK